LPILIAYRNTTTKKEMKEKMKAPMWAFQLALFDTHLIHPSALVLIICTHHFINKSWLLLGRVCVCLWATQFFLLVLKILKITQSARPLQKNFTFSGGSLNWICGVLTIFSFR
jgi:formate-dependent nitrite reductase membrane component NrfD